MIIQIKHQQNLLWAFISLKEIKEGLVFDRAGRENEVNKSSTVFA
jgi:hypothetical protein